MSSPYAKLGNRSLEQWRVTELREELKKRKLTTKGLKEDLVKRLDEAVRIELENSTENEENDPNQSKLSSKEENSNSDILGAGKEFMDIGIIMDKKTDAKPEPEIDDHRSLFEGEVEVSLKQGTKASSELEVGHYADVETTVVINETVETVTVVGNNDGLPLAEKDAKLELSDTKTQLPVVPSGEPDLEDSGNQDEEALHLEVQMETDDPKDHQPDFSDQPLKYQVSEVAHHLGFHVASASVSTESVSIIEKNELKVDVITDNVHLELDVKHEMAQSLPGNAVPDGDESHPLGVEEPLDKKEAEQPLHENDVEESFEKRCVDEPLGVGDKVFVEATSCSNAEIVNSLQDMDREDLVPEKLNLDRSSGDDSMEEDVVESKPMDYKSDSSNIVGTVENIGRHTLKEEDHVDVIGHDKPVETKPIIVENETDSALTSVKRKFHDKAAVGNSDPVKRAHRWNAEGLKGSEPQKSTTVFSTTPKGLSEPTSKPFSGTGLAVYEETQERVVPPPSRPPTNTLRIDRFLRPFTLKQVQELLGKSGTVAGFWMDHIKTHCYVSYSSVEEAVGTRNAVYNLQWPTNGGRLLVAEFVDPQEVKTRVEPPPPSPAKPTTTSIPQNHAPPQPSPRQHLPPPPPNPLANHLLARDRLHREALPPSREHPVPAREQLNLPPSLPLPEKAEPPIVTLDDLFRKTKAIPRIYYLPLSDEQVAAKMKAQGKNVVNP